jgi:hypothetical protein
MLNLKKIYGPQISDFSRDGVVLPRTTAKHPIASSITAVDAIR